jgi:predicted TIM-barrel fold metal-dependent hydrolase
VRRVREVFALANTLRLPILVHVGNNSGPEATVVANTRTFLDTVAAAAPRVTIQVAHLWGGGGYSGAALQAYADAVAARHPSTRNMYFDMAEAPMIAARMGPRKQEVMAQIVSAMRRIGLDRILFGSDEFGRSHHQPREAWQMFRDEVPLTEEEFRVVAANVAPYLR